MQSVLWLVLVGLGLRPLLPARSFWLSSGFYDGPALQGFPHSVDRVPRFGPGLTGAFAPASLCKCSISIVTLITDCSVVQHIAARYCCPWNGWFLDLFALCPALPDSLGGRDSTDYYWSAAPLLALATYPLTLSREPQRFRRCSHSNFSISLRCHSAILVTCEQAREAYPRG